MPATAKTMRIAALSGGYANVATSRARSSKQAGDSESPARLEAGACAGQIRAD
jgi:hypothetical protein